MPIKRPFTQDELKELVAQGYDMSSYDGRPVDFPDTTPAPTSSALGAGTRAAASSALPTVAGGLGFAGTMAALAPASGGVSLAAIPVGMGVSYLASKLAGKAQEAVMPEEWKQRLAQDYQEHPTATTVGGLAAMPLGGMTPAPSNTLKALSGAGKLAGGLGTKALSLAEKQSLINASGGAILGAGQDAATAALEGRDITLKDLAMNAAIGATFTKPTPYIGKAMGFHPVENRTVDSADALSRLLQGAEPAVKPAATKEEVVPPPQAKVEAEQAEPTQKFSGKLETNGDEVRLKEEGMFPAETADDLRKALEEEGASTNQMPQTGVKTGLKQEVEAALQQKNVADKPTPEYVDALARDVINKQNINVTADGNLTNPEGKPIRGVALIPKAIREIIYNTESAGLDTVPHEGLHYFRTELERAAQSGDKKAATLLQKWDSVSREGFEKYNEERIKNKQEPVDLHEYTVGEQGLEFVKQQLNLKGEKGLKRWWNDTKSLFKAKYDKNATVEDLRRAINYQFVNEQGRGKFVGKSGPLGDVEKDKSGGVFSGENRAKSQESELVEDVKAGRISTNLSSKSADRSVAIAFKYMADGFPPEQVYDVVTKNAKNLTKDVPTTQETRDARGNVRVENIFKKVPDIEPKFAKFLENIKGKKTLEEYVKAAKDAGIEITGRFDPDKNDFNRYQDLSPEELRKLRKQGSGDSKVPYPFSSKDTTFEKLFKKQSDEFFNEKNMKDIYALIDDTKAAIKAKGGDVSKITNDEVGGILDDPLYREELRQHIGDFDANRLIERYDEIASRTSPVNKKLTTIDQELHEGNLARNQEDDRAGTVPSQTNFQTNERYGFLSPLEATFDKVSRVDERLGQAGRNWEARKKQLLGTKNAAVEELGKFNRDNVNRVQQLMSNAYRTGTDLPPLAGVDREIYNVLSGYYTDIAQKQRDAGLLIDGRTRHMDENYIPHQLNDQTLNLFTTRVNTPEERHAVNQWVDHVVNSSDGAITEAEARKNITAYIRALGGEKHNYLALEFGPIRKAAGYGLPEALRETDAIRNLDKYGKRAANDLSMYMELESKPEIANLLHLRDPNTGQYHTGFDENSRIPADERVKNMMKWVTGGWSGTMSQSTPKVNALVRLVNNSLLGTATGIRNVAQMPVNMLPYIHQFSDLGAAWKGIMETRANSKAALETGAKQPNIDKLQFNELAEAPDRLTATLNKAATVLRKWQGAEALENLSRDVTFSIGRELARNNIIGARNGNAKSARWLERFGTIVDRTAPLDAQLDQYASNFVDANQGSYGGSGLPAGIVDSQFAPFFALQKWGVEKSNTIYKDVVKPFMSGENRIPMLTYALGTILTGAAIQKLNEAMTGKKGQDPDIKEALDKGDAKSIISELTTLMQLASFGGIVGDSLKAVSDIGLHGKTPRNLVSFPTATAALNLEEKTTDMIEAINQGEDPWSVLKAYTLDMISGQVQAARLLMNHTIKEDDVERTDKFRDVRVYNELEGKPASNMPSTNPYLGIAARDFKRSGDLGESLSMLPQLMEQAQSSSGGSIEKLRQKLQGLKGNSYQTMPSLTASPMEFSNYYQYLVRTQGQEEADKRMADYVRQSSLNKVKSAVVPSL